MSSHSKFGQLLGAALLGKSAADVNHAEGWYDVMSSQQAAPFKRELCKIASAAYLADDAGNTPEGILFRNLGNLKDDWSPGYDQFSDCVLRALSKQAMLPAVAAGHEALGGPLMKGLAAVGVLGGAGVGSLAFLLSRNAAQSSAENAELLEKVRVYKELRRDIEEDMRSKDIMSQGKKTNAGRDRYNV